MKIVIRKEIAAVTDEMIALRRDIHAHPELGFHEYRTGQLVADRLSELGLAVRRCAETGVIGVLTGGKPGKTVMLRCELDALPVTEENDLPFCSQNPGVMHACGHDANAAVQVAAAKVLAAHKEELPGTVVFLFQPNEEDCGAPPMIEDGALTDPRPDAIFATHVWSQLPMGTVGVVPGAMCASSYYFHITIHGKDTSAYAPYKGVNPLVAARNVMDAVDTMLVTEYSMLDEPTLINFCTIHAGDFVINIPDTLTMGGSIRCLHENEKAVHARFKELVEQVCKAYRCTCEVDIEMGNSMLENDPALYAIVKKQAAAMFGENSIIEDGIREFGGDDLAEFFREGIPGVYYLMGMGSEEKKTNAMHHSKEFLVDEDVMALQAEMQVRCVLNYLGEII